VTAKSAKTPSPRTIAIIRVRPNALPAQRACALSP
jgi:hypothetical protein